MDNEVDNQVNNVLSTSYMYMYADEVDNVFLRSPVEQRLCTSPTARSPVQKRPGWLLTSRSGRRSGSASRLTAAIRQLFARPVQTRRRVGLYFPSTCSLPPNPRRVLCSRNPLCNARRSDTIWSGNRWHQPLMSPKAF
jgi:hypothetical protein